MRLVDIGHADVQAWVTKFTKTLAASTVRQIYLVLAGLAKYAGRDVVSPATRARVCSFPGS